MGNKENVKALIGIFARIGLPHHENDKPNLSDVKEELTSIKLLKELGSDASTITQSELDSAWDIYLNDRYEVIYKLNADDELKIEELNNGRIKYKPRNVEC